MPWRLGALGLDVGSLLNDMGHVDSKRGYYGHWCSLYMPWSDLVQPSKGSIRTLHHGVYGDLSIIYPNPYSLYLRGDYMVVEVASSDCLLSWFWLSTLIARQCEVDQRAFAQKGLLRVPYGDE